MIRPARALSTALATVTTVLTSAMALAASSVSNPARQTIDTDRSAISIEIVLPHQRRRRAITLESGEVFFDAEDLMKSRLTMAFSLGRIDWFKLAPGDAMSQRHAPQHKPLALHFSSNQIVRIHDDLLLASGLLRVGDASTRVEFPFTVASAKGMAVIEADMTLELGAPLSILGSANPTDRRERTSVDNHTPTAARSCRAH